MNLERPDLSAVDPAVVAYIETLEAELAQVRERGQSSRRQHESAVERSDPSEPPTTINVVTISAGGLAKRTPRHLYGRQRRGGMGVFDLDAPEDDAPAFLALADESESLVLISNNGRAFRLPLSALAEVPVRSRGQAMFEHAPMAINERLACVTPAGGGNYLTLVTERGQVRRYPVHNFAEAMRPGVVLYDIQYGGPPAAVCWTAGDDDLLIATRQGRAIRFAEKQVPVRGCLGIRLERDDTVAAAAAVKDASNLFILGADGKGAIRAMSGFGANKAPGSGGKTLFKTDALIGAMPVTDTDDIFIISRLGKIIRFQAVETPAKEGVVQGVNCMEFRADEAMAVAITR